MLDGRHVTVPGYESGNFVGPTLLSGVTTDMDCWKTEIFGPVLVCLEVRTLQLYTTYTKFVSHPKF